MARLFGTDGVRGLANRDITPELALSLATAAASVLAESGEFLGHRPLAIVGRDPRASGEFLSAAVISGLASAGLDVLDVGVIPTPAVAYLTSARNADLGVMLSASHNAMPDNGIKFFARGGHKLPDEVEDAIERRMADQAALPRIRPTGASVGRVRSSIEAADEYIAHLLAALPNSLAGLSVVLDCAHGAASAVAPRLFHAAGADVCVIGASPTGLNINDGHGSTHLAALQEAVLRIGADIGIAFDGDADRCLAVDSRGGIVDGDQIMAILAISLRDRGLLRKNTLVATVMSNLGLLLAMAREGIEIETTAVGDRYVLERMRADGFSLGGEQSGHVIFADHGTTGDGLLTGLLLAARMVESQKNISELASVMQRLPQVMVNVPDVDKSRAGNDVAVLEAIAAAELELAGNGRVLLRPSGTEPLVRVMVEADESARAQKLADQLAVIVRQRLAL